MIALDTETTGSDFWHGCKPYYVSAANALSEIWYWEWDVDPYTRQPQIPKSNIEEIKDLIISSLEASAHNISYKSDIGIVFQNAKFDIRALSTIGIDIPSLIGWDNIHDTLVMSHCLNSLEPHGLKYLAHKYLGIPSDDQRELQQIVQRCRNKCPKDKILTTGETVKGWRIAKPHDSNWPGIKQAPGNSKTGDSGWWVFDMWLPLTYHKYITSLHTQAVNNHHKAGKNKIQLRKSLRALNELTTELSIIENYPYQLGKYGNRDVERTILLYYLFQNKLHNENLWNQYEHRRQMLETTYVQENVGFTIDLTNLQHQIHYYEQETARIDKGLCSFGIRNPQSHQQIADYLHTNLGLPILQRTDTGKPKTDTATLEQLAEHLKNKNTDIDPQTIQQGKQVLTSLLQRSGNATSLRYLEGYNKWRSGNKVHSTVNITGTKELRQSMSNPNLQNIGTGKDE